MSALSILIVDDDSLARTVLTKQLAGHRTDAAHDLTSARREFEKNSYDLCFLDLALGTDDHCSGLELISDARARGTYCVVMSGHDSEEMVERAYALGCQDFYAKGTEGTDGRTVVSRFLAGRQSGGPEDDIFRTGFVTRDPATRASVLGALRYAAADLPIFILGPSGTGKTSLAKLIHDRSGRQGAFVSINCAAFAEDLLEAELFGYRRGAFSGATESRKGQLLAADGGTLFLDEIGSMSLKMQTKLLKAIEERAFYPLGSEKIERSSFRVISATLEDPHALVKRGAMRFDFFQRVQGFTVDLKPLAERRGDILALVEHFTRAGRRLSFTADAKQLVGAYDWPGNVRELRRVVELLVAGPAGLISADAISRLLVPTAGVPAAAGGFVTEEQYQVALREGLQSATDRFVDAIIGRSLHEHGGRKNRVLAALQISTRILYASLNRALAGSDPEKPNDTSP